VPRARRSVQPDSYWHVPSGGQFQPVCALRA